MTLLRVIPTPRYCFAALSFCFIFILIVSFRDVSNWQSTLQQHLGAGSIRVQHSSVVSTIAHDLDILYDGALDISNFAAMGERFSKFSLLTESTLAARPVDTKPLLRRLKKYYPWWQPLPTTYTPWQQDHRAPAGGTGIVICVGSSNLIYAIHLVLSLRNVLNSKLPIQIAYAGNSDLSFTDRVNITDLGPDIEALNLLDVFDEEIAGLENGGWAMKPFAMLASRFQKTIVLDADAMFVRSPDDLFETEPGLIETGTLFWHDRAFNPDSEEPITWVKSLIGDRQPSTLLNSSLLWQNGVFHEMDSAAVCMDKGRPKVFMSLLFATWMNLRQVRDEVTYTHVHGDKETFWLACELSYTPYHYSPGYAGIIGTPKKLEVNDDPSEDSSADEQKEEQSQESSEEIVEGSVSAGSTEEAQQEASSGEVKTETIYEEPQSEERPAYEQVKFSNDTSSELRAALKNESKETQKRNLHTLQTRELATRNFTSPPNQTLDLHEICSAQALHLDHRRRPLWFNGSLRKDKSLINDSLDRLKYLISGKRPLELEPESDNPSEPESDNPSEPDPQSEYLAQSLSDEELEASIKEEIKTIAGFVALGKFTHWMPGAENWTDARPDYQVGTVTSCLVLNENSTATELDNIMRENLGKIVEIAREVDQHFYGFDKANVALVPED